jgi:hypothetical protein
MADDAPEERFRRHAAILEGLARLPEVQHDIHQGHRASSIEPDIGGGVGCSGECATRWGSRRAGQPQNSPSRAQHAQQG